MNNNTNNNNHKSNKLKTFGILDYPKKGNIYGNFNAKYPSDAAKKVYSMLCKKYNFYDNENGKIYLGFHIINKDTKKIYEYVGTSIKLKEPIQIKKGNKQFFIHYRPIVTKFDPNIKNIFTKIKQD